MNQGRGDGGNRIHISLIRPIYFVDVANIAIDPVQKPDFKLAWDNTRVDTFSHLILRAFTNMVLLNIEIYSNFQIRFT
jgi:hypothetical protein